MRRPAGRRLAYWMIEQSLRHAFRRIEWHGDPPVLDTRRPIILYANHNGFYDGHLLCWMLERWLARHAIIWMQLYDRFPFFGAAGALPFPDDAGRRARTVRQTARLMAERPDAALVYFPEGHLHAAEDGVAPIESDRFARLDRIFPHKAWWPVAVRVSGWHDARPTAMLTSGALHPCTTGCEREQMIDMIHRLALRRPGTGTVLLEGRANPQDRWDFSFLRRGRSS